MIELTEPMRLQAGSNLREFGYDVTQEFVNETIDGIVANPEGDLPNGIIGMMLKDMLVKANIIGKGDGD